MKTPKRLTAVSGAIVAMASIAAGHPMMPTDAPIDRVITNLQAKLAENPKDADAYYLLGRAHALAYATKLDRIRGFGRDPNSFTPLPPDCEDYRSRRDSKSDAKPLPADQLPAHLEQAVKNLAEATRLDRNPRYYLALGSVLETASDDRLVLDPALILYKSRYAQQPGDGYVDRIPDGHGDTVARARALGGTMDPAKWSRADASTLGALWKARDDENPTRRDVVREILRDFWTEQTVDAYFNAFAIALAEEGKFDDRPMGTLGLRITLEAGQSFLRTAMLRTRDFADTARVAIVTKAVEELSKQEMGGGITPIVFSFHDTGSLSSLVDAHSRVPFRLDGTTRPQHWPWLKPTTGLLCWDPTNSGRITSGRQLFGSVSWWLFFRNGYEALDALDDNRDGSLAGPELRGISIWFDRNSNAISDPGEVTPIQSLGIAALSCRATATSDGCPANPTGLTLADGRSLPTYDWIAEPLPASESDKPGPRSLTPLAIAAAALFAPLAIRRRHA